MPHPFLLAFEATFERGFMLKLVAIEILGACNLFCDFCVRNALSRDRRKIEIPDFIRIIDKLGSYAEVAITGGEPFMHPQLFDISRILSEKKIRFSITTNGTIKKWLLDIIKFTYFKHFIISIDSHIPKTHDLIRGKNAFNRTMDFVEICKKNKARFLINMTVNDHNYKDVRGTIELAKRLGASDISIATVKPNGRGKALLTRDQIDMVWSEVSSCQELFGNDFKIRGTDITFFLYSMKNYAQEIKNGNSRSCAFGGSTLHIQVDGKILGCTSCAFSIGNIFELKETLQEFHKNNTTLKEVREKTRLSGVCSSCKFKNFCGGCRCRSFGMTGDLFGSDPYCKIVSSEEKLAC